MNEQRLTPEFYTTLDQCLDAVLAGRVTVEVCLARFPQYADLLKPELQAAALTTYLEVPVMEAAQVDALEDRLRAQMQAQTSTQTRPQSQTSRPRNIISFVSLPISRMAAAIMIAFLLAIGSGAGVVAASSDSLPGDPLYGIKRLWEAIILLLSPLTGELDDLWLHLAKTRLDEALRLAEAGQLTDEALLEVYQSTLTLIQLADPTTAAQAAVYMEEGQQLLLEQKPAPQQAALYADVLELLKPVLTEDGRFQAPANLTPPSQVVPAVLATATDILPTATTIPLTPTPTVTPTVIPPTDTATATDTATIVPSDTSTPRFPATATNSPTVRATFTWTPSPTDVPTTTWTPLPLPEGPSATPVSPVPLVTSAPSGGSSDDDDDTEPTLRYNATYWMRATQKSVYMTQTAGPPATEEPSS